MKKKLEDLREAFLEWKDSDNVVHLEDGYATQCTQYVPRFSFFRLYRYFINEYGDFYLN